MHPKKFYVLLCACLIALFAVCAQAEGAGLQILHHSVNNPEDTWPWIYAKGEEIPGFEMTCDQVDGFTVTLYRSIYEYDSMHPMVVLFVDQPEGQAPCAYGCRITTAQGSFYGGFSASPWHCILLNSVEPADVTFEMFLFGEDGEDILADIFENQREETMDTRAETSMRYSFRVCSVADE